MIIYAALVPHAQELLRAPEERALRFPIVSRALQTQQEHLYARKPDALVLISSHGAQMRYSCTMDMMPLPVVHHFGESKDEQARLFQPDIETSTRLRALTECSQEFMYAPHDVLNGEALVSLALLLEHLPDVHVLRLTTAYRDNAFHMHVGKILEEVLTALPLRYAVVISADLASIKTLDASAHRARLDALEFDREFLEIIGKGKYRDALERGQMRSRSVSQCVLDPSALLFGLLASCKNRSIVLGYESPFGTGVAVVEFEL